VTCDGKPIRRLVFINGGVCLSKRWRHRLLKIVVISRLKIAPIFFSQVAIQHQLGTNRADTSSLSSECYRRKIRSYLADFYSLGVGAVTASSVAAEVSLGSFFLEIFSTK
jgi:hypothetical protein